jgi:hypothetical protein
MSPDEFIFVFGRKEVPVGKDMRLEVPVVGSEQTSELLRDAVPGADMHPLDPHFARHSA